MDLSRDDVPVSKWREISCGGATLTRFDLWCIIVVLDSHAEKAQAGRAES